MKTVHLATPAEDNASWNWEVAIVLGDGVAKNLFDCEEIGRNLLGDAWSSDRPTCRHNYATVRENSTGAELAGTQNTPEKSGGFFDFLNEELAESRDQPLAVCVIMYGLMVGVQQPLSRSPGGLEVASTASNSSLMLLAHDLWMLSRAAWVACW